MGGLKYLCVHTNTQEIQQVRTSDKSTHTDADADPAGVGLYSAGAAEMTLSLWLRRTTVAENGVKGRGLNIHKDWGELTESELEIHLGKVNSMHICSTYFDH